MKKSAIFLDRDGTLNIESDFLFKIEELEWIPGAIQAIKKINEMDYYAIIISNQSGIARSYYTEDDVIALHNQIDKILISKNAHIDHYYFCPHHPEYGEINNCSCRKPNTGMLEKAFSEFNINKEHSYLIGDRCTDIEAAIRFGITPIMVETGYGMHEKNTCDHNFVLKKNVLDAVKYIFDY